MEFSSSKNDNIQIHQYIEMSQDLNANTCSCPVIFMYWTHENPDVGNRYFINSVATAPVICLI